MGRYYAMDRDNRWDRVELAYKALTKGEGVQAECPVCAVKASYEEGKTDEFVVPTVIVKDGQPVGTIQDKDSVIFFNFRPDRAREITRAFCADEFDGLRERRDWILPMCASQNMILLSQIQKWPSTRFPFRILLGNFLRPTD